MSIYDEYIISSNYVVVCRLRPIFILIYCVYFLDVQLDRVIALRSLHDDSDGDSE